MTDHKLSEAIAKQYEATITPTYVEHPIKDEKTGRKTGMIKVDLRTGTLAQANALVKAGFKGLKEKKSSSKEN